MGFKLKLGHVLDPWTSAINRGIDKGFSNVGGALNDLTGSSEMLNKEYANNVALWNMQNDYNTPAAQMARMKAAGIDVNPMTYAVGNGNMSTTASNISAPSVGASGVNPIAMLMSVMSGIEGIKSQRLANEMTKKDLDFYERLGYRPGTSDWMTILPGLWSKYGSKVSEFLKSLIPGNSGKGGYTERIINYFWPLHDIDYDPEYRDGYDLQGNHFRYRKPRNRI